MIFDRVLFFLSFFFFAFPAPMLREKEIGFLPVALSDDGGGVVDSDDDGSAIVNIFQLSFVLSARSIIDFCCCSFCICGNGLPERDRG